METPQKKKTKTTHDTLTSCSPSSSGQHHKAVAEKQDRSTEKQDRSISTFLIDIAALQNKWTPDRELRIREKEKKIRSAGNNAIRGGDWVINESGGAATLSFCFEYRSQIYGLTVGHLADVGESIFIFAENEKQQNPCLCSENPSYSYPMWEIGTVVSKSVDTDSLVFLIHYEVLAVDIAPRKLLAEESGLNCPIELPDPTKDSFRPAEDDLLVGFGAQRRGVVGKVLQPSESASGTFSRVGNISMVHPEDTNLMLTDEGDCGTIFIGLDGTPLYFHHCASCVQPKVSYGFPLAQVMVAHTQLGGVSRNDQQQQQQQLSTKRKNPDILQDHQLSGLKQFSTHIVPTPLVPQTNALAQFDVHIVPAPKRTGMDGGKKSLKS